MIYTTLNRIRAHGPCGIDPRKTPLTGYQKLVAHLGEGHDADAPVSFAAILESNGLDDALWCLRAEPQHANLWRLYAVRCARSVQHLMTDPRSTEALDMAERHARGQATDEELATARNAAWAAWAASRDASWAAWAAARAAARAVWVAARAAMAARDAAMAARDAAMAAMAAREAFSEDLKRLLFAHKAAPGEWCELVDWQQPTED